MATTAAAAIELSCNLISAEPCHAGQPSQPANILPSWQRCQIRRRQEKKVGKKKKKEEKCVCFVCLPLFVLKENIAPARIEKEEEEEGTLRLSETFFSWWQRDELLHTLSLSLSP